VLDFEVYNLCNRKSNEHFGLKPERVISMNIVIIKNSDRHTFEARDDKFALTGPSFFIPYIDGLKSIALVRSPFRAFLKNNQKNVITSNFTSFLVVFLL
jgi:hypothetical protein